MGISKSKGFTEELEDIIDDFFEELMVRLRRQAVAFDEFHRSYLHWLTKRNEVIAELEVLEKDLDKHHRNVNIANLSGSSVSLASGFAGVAGLALAPFTGFASAALVAGSMLGISAGTLTGAGASVVEFGLRFKINKDVTNLINEDCQEMLLLTFAVNNCSKLHEDTQSFVRENAAIIMQRDKNNVLSKFVTNESVKDSLRRIKTGCASNSDYDLLIHFICCNNFENLKCLKKINLTEFSGKICTKMLTMGQHLRKSVSTTKSCVVIFKDWKAGASTSTLVAASKSARIMKGAAIGLSIAADVYDIYSTAKELFQAKQSTYPAHFHNVIQQLKTQKDEVTEFYIGLN